MHTADIYRIRDYKDGIEIDELREWEIAAREQEERRMGFWQFVAYLGIMAIGWGFFLRYLFPGPR